MSTKDFETYLTKVLTSSKDTRYLSVLANKYRQVLESGNASVLQTITPDKKRQIMRALAHLAKYNGIYERWQKIIKNHGIHWRQAKSDTFDFFEKESITEMIDHIK